MLEGRGSTEVWRNGDTAMTAFEWQPWSLFAIPLNANFRIINASSAPALLLAVNSAPRTINAFQNMNFVFNCEFNFDDRLGGNLEDFWNPNDEIEPQPVRGRAMVTSNLLPDIQNAYLPARQNRPRFRWVAPNQVGNTMIQGWSRSTQRRYARRMRTPRVAVLVCARRRLSWTWAKQRGRPDAVKGWARATSSDTGVRARRLISAPAPGPANWFHQHFAVGKNRFRVFNYTGPMPGNPESSRNRQTTLRRKGN